MNKEECEEEARALLVARRIIYMAITKETRELELGLDEGEIEVVASQVTGFYLDKLKEAAAKPRGN